MADFAAIFRTHLGRPGEDLPAHLSGPALAEQLAALCTRGHAAFPELSLADEAFVIHLAGCVARMVAYPPSLADLAIEDLFLSCACLADTPGAVAAFDARCAAPIRAALAFLPRPDAERDEIEQQLRVRLLVGDAESPPRIAGYLGLGALGRWVGVAAQRLAISRQRSDEIEMGARDRAAIDAACDWKDPAIVLAKERFRAEFQRALADALSHLDDRDRILLRMHFVNGMSTRRISTIYGVSQPTASRWLQAARSGVADQTQRLLRERLRLEPQEIDSLAALVASQLDLSLSRLLEGTASK